MERSEALISAARDRGIDGCIVAAGANRRYFSGFTGSSARLFIAPDVRRIVTDFRYMEQVKRQCAGFEAQVAARGEDVSALAGVVAAAKARRVGFEAQSVSVALYEAFKAAMPDVEFIPIDDDISRLRAIKSQSELNAIREAVRIADVVFAETLEFLRPGRTELETAAFIEYRMKMHGAQGASFAPIIASGENAALPHAAPSEKPIMAGELVVMDFGAQYEGYCSDMTRTVAVGGATDEQRALYALVLKAQERAIAGVRPGMTAKEADALARDVIADAGYGEQFGHGLGHGVGLDIHEGPTLNHSSDDVLAPGMIITIEPGVYIPGFTGVRIEDMLALTNGAAQNFTSSIKDFVVL